MDSVTFDVATSQLSFVPAFFKGKPNRFVSWRKGISSGTLIKVGTTLAEIQWDDGTNEFIKSPVAGTILKTNRQIIHDRLHKAPAQLALILASKGDPS